MKNHVIFDENYFKKTISEYKDWELAFVRETAQNSSDAHSTKIEYTITDTEDGYIKIVCKDNGKGMNKDILLNKFLVMGGSHKDSEDSVGGFGYAKGIILFCHHSYQIKTNDLMITGSYGRYGDIEEIKHQQGTEITIFMEDNMSSVGVLKRKLRHWVSQSNLKGTDVYLNDELLEQLTTKFQYKKQTKIGKLQFNVLDYSYSSTIWVRMRGMAMFSKSVFTNDEHFDAYIDLDAQSSLECLTANRDGLKQDYDNGLNDLIQYLSTEMSQYKVSEMDDFEINNRPVNLYEQIQSLKKEKEKVEEQLIEESINDNIVEVIDKKELKEEHYNRANIEESMSNIIDEDDKNSILEKVKKNKDGMKPKINNILSKIDSSNYPHSFLIKIDNLEDKKNQEVLKEYNKSVKLINQSRVKKYAPLWRKIVNSVLDVAFNANLIYGYKENEQYYYNGKVINYGFIMSEDSETAGMASLGKDKSYILMNPILSKREEYSRKILLEIAIHEVAHLVYANHSKSHSYLIFAIQIAFDRAKININKL